MSEAISTYKLKFNSAFKSEQLNNGIYLVVMHANRIPPHIGMVINGYYHSLSIKGQDIKTPVEALIKNIKLRAIPSLFIEIKQTDSYNDIYLMNRFIESVKQFPKVDVNVATCLSPIKLFFDEVYDISTNEINYLYELLPLLEDNSLIKSSCSLFIDEKKYELPFYTMDNIHQEINRVREEYK